ncbi:MAG: GNAT family N-acetyltransferase [Pseudomonadota bacterium]
MMKIVQADLALVDELAPLLDAYRQFYEQPADLEKSRSYLHDRLANDQSVIFLARLNGAAAGFTQLYPTFCSVAAAPVFVLYDLFVASEARRKGVATALMARAQDFARGAGGAWLKLETAVTNAPGQALYEKIGWERDNDFYTYHYDLADEHGAA